MYPHAQHDMFAAADLERISQDAMQAFDFWLLTAHGRSMGKPLGADSAAVYRDMWSAFTKWLTAERLSLASVRAADLDQYLRTRAGRTGEASDLDDRYAWRMLRLVERVLAQHARTSKTAPSTAVAELLLERRSIRYANAQHDDPAPEFLDASDARALVAFLSAPLSVGSIGADWKDARDRSAVALHLGAGLTPGEVRALTVQDVLGLRQGTRKIRVIANETVKAHETPIAGWAWRVLNSWLDVRATLSVPSNVLFPSTRSGGRAWGKTGHYEAVKGVLLAVGLPESGGAFRLRHTFALRQLKRGTRASDIAAWMGIDERAVSRYRNVVYGDQLVV